METSGVAALFVRLVAQSAASQIGPLALLDEVLQLPAHLLEVLGVAKKGVSVDGTLEDLFGQWLVGGLLDLVLVLLGLDLGEPFRLGLLDLGLLALLLRLQLFVVSLDLEDRAFKLELLVLELLLLLFRLYLRLARRNLFPLLAELLDRELLALRFNLFQ